MLFLSVRYLPPRDSLGVDFLCPPDSQICPWIVPASHQQDTGLVKNGVAAQFYQLLAQDGLNYARPRFIRSSCGLMDKAPPS